MTRDAILTRGRVSLGATAARSGATRGENARGTKSKQKLTENLFMDGDQGSVAVRVRLENAAAAILMIMFT